MIFYRFQSWYYRTFHPGLIRFARHPDFYKTRQWMEARYACLRRYGGRCRLCGIRGGQRYQDCGSIAIIHVDHRFPKSKYPWLCLTVKWLQPLCAKCNKGKSNKYTDWWIEK